jgi:TolB-like protein/Tfp pilus assembly protein PilF
MLRRALAESPNDPAFIETVPKRGYRFVAAVVEVEEDEAELILERRTSAEIITEVEEEVSDRQYADHVIEPLTITRAHDHARLIAKWHSSFGRRSAVVVLILVAAIFFWWTNGLRAHDATTATVKSLAVLPFKDMSASGEEHLGLALADVLITRLSNLKDVQVRPTSAVQKFEGQDQESTAAGQMLGVDAVLEGSMHRRHDQIRVTVRLLRVGTKSPIWSGQFEDEAKDVLAMQSAIAEQVAQALALRLTAGEKRALAKRYSEDADAFQLYVKGRYYWNKRSWPGMSQAEYFFRRAIERDPEFALAYLGLADMLFTGSAHPEAYTALNKAVELDPNLGEAYATMGFAQMFHEWDWQKAEASFRRSIELKPGYGTAHQWYATLLAITGRVDEAKQEMQRALEIDPMSANFLADQGQMYYFAREYGEAESYCRKALEVAPDFILAHMYLFDIYAKTGREAEAIDEWRKRDRSNAFDARPANGPEVDARLRAEDFQSGVTGFLRRRVKELDERCHGACYGLAKYSALLGEREQALQGLEKSYNVKDFFLPFVNADPSFDGIRTEPRFQALVRRLNLTPQ